MLRGTERVSADNIPLRMIPAGGKVPENNVDSSPEKRADVLHDDVAGSNLTNDPGVLTPESGTGTANSDTFAGFADVLAGEASADDIGSGNKVPCKLMSSDPSHVLVNLDAGPIGREHVATPRLSLAEGDRLHARALKPEGKAADAREEVQHAH